jgi:hypothetical protein
MDKEKRSKFMEMIHDEIGEDHKLVPIIASLMGMVDNDERFEELFEIHEGIEEYGQFLTEKEAKQVVDRMQNYDGSRGARWQPAVLFDAVQLLGGEKAVRGKYNCWALYALMNMMSSDYGDAIQEVAKGDDYALTCYRMSLSWMKDKDHRNDVREYFLE